MNAINVESSNKDELRKFGLTTGGLIAGLFGLIFPFVFRRHFVLWPWIAGGILEIWALVLPTYLAPVFKYWMRFANALGWINTRIILSLVFYLLLTPFGLLMRLFARDPMARKFDRNTASYRVESTAAPPETLKRPF